MFIDAQVMEALGVTQVLPKYPTSTVVATATSVAPVPTVAPFPKINKQVAEDAGQRTLWLVVKKKIELFLT
jgi:hypothetical protein